MKEDFFIEASEASKKKIEIVSKYFSAWSKVILSKSKGRINYIDLYSGRGKYEDGTKSVPILILENAVNDFSLSNRLVALLNDSEESKNLAKQIASIPGINKMKHSPKIHSIEVDEGFEKVFESVSINPTLLFIDPWGYKGLTLKLIKSVIKDWGCDCIFFFNYNRINMALDNPVLSRNASLIFGEERFKKLKSLVVGKSPFKRERLIMDTLVESLNDIGGKYTVDYRFTDESGKKTSHYLVFVSKNILGYSIMKDIMAKASSSHEDGVPSYTFSTVACGEINSMFPKIDELKNLLLKKYRGRKIRCGDLINEHSIGKPFIAKSTSLFCSNLKKKA